MLTYEQQLAQLRQAVTNERDAPVQNEASKPDSEWNDTPEDKAEKAIAERMKQEEWIDEAGLTDTILTRDPRWPKDQMEQFRMFENDIKNNKYYKHYGTQLEEMAMELYRQVADPESPIDEKQAMSMAQELLTRMKLEVDNGAE